MKNTEIGLYAHESELEQLRFYLRTGRQMSEKELHETGNWQFDYNYSGIITNDDFGTLIQGILDLCKSCYWFGINPLPQFRKLFPEFEWLYLYTLDKPNDLFGEVRAIDPEYIFSISSGFEAVVARKKGRRKNADFKLFVSDECTDVDVEKRFSDLGYQILGK